MLHSGHMGTRITRLVILHGYGVTSRSMWFPWLQKTAEKLGLAVYAPSLPDPLRPDLRKWIKAVRAQARTWGEETAIVGHSAGGILTLRLVEHEVAQRIGPVFIVSSPYAATLNVKQYVSFFRETIDWGLLRRKAVSYSVLHAKDDPLVPYDHAMRYAESLGGTFTLLSNGGHLIGKKLPRLAKMLTDVLAAGRTQ